MVALIGIAAHFGVAGYWSSLFTPNYAAGAWGLPLSIIATAALGISLFVRREVGAGEYLILVAIGAYLVWLGAFAGVAGVGLAIASLAQVSSHDV